MERDASFEHIVEKIITIKQGHLSKLEGQIMAPRCSWVKPKIYKVK